MSWLVIVGTVLQERLSGFYGAGLIYVCSTDLSSSLSMDIPTYFVIFVVINYDEMVISWTLTEPSADEIKAVDNTGNHTISELGHFSSDWESQK